MTPEEAEDISADLLKLMKGDFKKKHLFWDAQPMSPRDDLKHLPDGPIVSNEEHMSNLRETPYPLPDQFYWADVDVNNPQHLQDLYKLTYHNYSPPETDEQLNLRSTFSKEFLQWTLTFPGSRPDFNVGIRTANNGRLVAFISAMVTNIRVKTTPSIRAANVDLLCIHKKLRGKRLAPILMKEIKRRANNAGIFQAIIMSGHVLSTALCKSRYFHRALNPMKLADIGFSGKPTSMGAKYKLPLAPLNAALRPMTEADVEGVHALLTNYLESKCQWHIVYTQDEIAHLLLPRKGVLDSYVVSDANGKITDMSSFFHSPSEVVGQNATLCQVYGMYNVATSMSLSELMRDTLVLAKQLGMDVYNSNDLMENKTFHDELEFGVGDGVLRYYLYNWSCGPEMAPKDVGMIPVT